MHLVLLQICLVPHYNFMFPTDILSSSLNMVIIFILDYELGHDSTQSVCRTVSPVCRSSASANTARLRRTLPGLGWTWEFLFCLLWFGFRGGIPVYFHQMFGKVLFWEYFKTWLEVFWTAQATWSWLKCAHEGQSQFLIISRVVFLFLTPDLPWA